MAKFTKEKINELSEKLLINLTDEENEMILKEFNETKIELFAVKLEKNFISY